MKKFFIELIAIFLSVTMLVCFTACNEKSKVQEYAQQQINVNAANSYINNLNASPTKILSDDEVALAKNEGLLSEIEIDSSLIDKSKKVVYKKRTAKCGINDLLYYGANDNITFPGSLLKINNTGTELSPIVGLKRKPLKLSLGIEGATGIEYTPTTVDEITKSSVGQGINKMVNSATQSGAQLPFVIAVQLTEIKAKEELNAALGLSFNAGSLFDLSSKFNFKTKFNDKTKNENTFAVLTLKQIYYTVNVDYNFENGVFNLLNDKVNFNQLQKACPSNCAPVYVSSVSYGRIAAITIKTSDSFGELSEKLNLGGGYWKLDADVESNFDESTQINNLEYNWFVYGGSIAGNQEVLNGTNIKDMINSLNQPYDPTKSVGMPISYQLSYIADNSSANIGYIGDYYYAEVVDKDAHLSDGMTDRIETKFDREILVQPNLKAYNAYGAAFVANNECLKIDISELDLDYIKNLGHNIEITIELSIKEVDNGYQEIYLYNAGVNAGEVQKGTAPMIASIIIEHGVNTLNTNYQRYTLKAVVSPDTITKKELWIAFDAFGKYTDDWKVKDINVILNRVNENIYPMYLSN